jgi:carboxyl-terminal processing protease
MDGSQEGAQRRAQHRRDALHLGVGVALGAALGLLGARILARAEDPDAATYREVRSFVERTYVREVGREVLLDSALAGMVERLDPYSRYYGPDEVAAVERETSGHYQGIGVVFAQPTSEARVLFTLAGSPAEKAGLRVGDQLVRVGGANVAGMAASELRQRLGERDRAALELELRGRDGALRTVSIGQEALVDPTVRHARIVAPGVGYLALSAFSGETPAEFDAAVSDLREQGASALVLDLRGNLGGVLRSATRIANRFLRAGLIVSHEGRDATQRYEANESVATLAGMPLAILVDRESASASEVLAAALQEHRVAVTVGAPTFGKGLVQRVESFGDGERVVKLVSAYYYTPSHRNIERTVEGSWEHGLEPDLLVKLEPEEEELVRKFLASYSPPRAALADLAAWEVEVGREVYLRPPADPQLHAALALLRGEHPCAVEDAR